MVGPYSTTKIELSLYKDILAGTKDTSKFHVPVVGTFFISKVKGEAAFDLNCSVQVRFDGQLVWFTKGSSEMPVTKMFTGDGVKKVELILDALDLVTGSVYLGGYVLIEEA